MPNRTAWLPIPLSLVVIAVLWATDSRASYELPYVFLCLNFAFPALVSLFVAYLVGRSFIVRGMPGLLLLGCGALIWAGGGLMGTVIDLLRDGSDLSSTSLLVSIQNICAWVSSLCHLAGLACSFRWGASLRSPRLCLAVAYSLAMAAVGFVTLAVLSGWTPAFLVEGNIGTLVRGYVLGSAIFMFVLTAVLLRLANRANPSAFAHWYSLALLLLAGGLFGVMVQPFFGSILGWTGRATQFVGGAYMLVAAIGSARESDPRASILGQPQQETHLKYVIAIALAFSAAVVRLLFLQGLGMRFTFVTFYPVVMMAALYGGLQAGLLATAFSALLADYFWIEPAGFGIGGPANGLGMSVFLLSCVMISWITEGMHRAQSRAQKAEVELAAQRDRLKELVNLRTAQNEFLASILESSNQPFGTGYPDGRLGLVNSAFAKLTGYTKDELASIDWLETLTPPEWQQIEREKLKELRRTGQPIRYEKEYLRKDGSRVPIELLVHQKIDSTGNPECYYSFLTDITERKLAEEALSQERLFLRKILDTTPSMIFVKDREGRFLLANWALARCYGSTPEKITGKTDADYNSNAEEVANFKMDDLEVINTGRTKHISEERVSCADGSVHWFSTVKIPLLNDDGSSDKMLGVAVDITERKRAEEALARQTVQLQEQAQQLLEADRRKDEFLAMLGHELRNPLTPIMIAAQMLKKRGAEDPALVDWAGTTIKHQCEHLTELVNQLLDVSRVTQGKIALNKASIELGELLSRAVQTVQPLIDRHQHELVLSLAPEPIIIDADPVRLEQVVGNLLNNAAKYTPDGGRIRVELAREAEAAVIRVRDSGIGMPAAMLPRIFKLFVQAERTLDRAQGGLGIGLSLVKSLVEMHGGSVVAMSGGVGLGSEFVVRLPLQLQAMRGNEALEAGNCCTIPIPARRILVVDDNEEVLHSLSFLLKTMGQETHEAHGGKEALSIAKTVPLDIVLLDIGMPALNGYEVARQLRQNPQLKQLKLIAMTGYGQDYDIQKSRRAGFDHHLVKPIDPRTLEKLLADFELPILQKPA